MRMRTEGKTYNNNYRKKIEFFRGGFDHPVVSARRQQHDPLQRIFLARLSCLVAQQSQHFATVLFGHTTNMQLATDGMGFDLLASRTQQPRL